jgi:hypothetical protein
MKTPEDGRSGVAEGLQYYAYGCALSALALPPSGVFIGIALDL